MGLLRHRDDGPAPTRYRMQEKLISIGDDYWVEDAEGARAYKVDGKALRVRDTWILKDLGDHDVATIRERKLSVRDAMTIELDGRKAVHYFDYGATSRDAFSATDRATLPHYAHPVGRVHPLSHRTALYVCRLMTNCIEGLPEDESRALLAGLFDAIERP